MITIDSAPKNVLALRLSGVVDESDITLIDPEEKADAMSFAAASIAAEATTGPAHGVKIIGTGNADLVAFEMTGVLTADDVGQMTGPLRAWLKSGQ